MSNETKGYNGWTNYETWCVHLWLSNDEGSYKHWRQEARHYRRIAHSDENVKEGRWSAEEQTRYSLGLAIKDYHDFYHPFHGEYCPGSSEPSVYSDLLNAALSEVEWSEIAEAFLEELEPENEPDPEDEQTDDEEDDSEEAEQKEAQGPQGPRFELGQVVSTPGALEAITREEILTALSRHSQGDWGEVGPDDWQENETSLREGFRLLSAYRSKNGERFWVITEADRSVTTILLPSEY